MKEIVLKIPIDEAEKLIYALNHAGYTGDEHIDAVLDTFSRVLKEQMHDCCSACGE